MGQLADKKQEESNKFFKQLMMASITGTVLMVMTGSILWFLGVLIIWIVFLR